MNNEEFYTVNEVIRMLRITRQTLDNWRKQGTIEAVKLQKRVLFRKSEIERLLNESSN